MILRGMFHPHKKLKMVMNGIHFLGFWILCMVHGKFSGSKQALITVKSQCQD